VTELRRKGHLTLLSGGRGSRLLEAVYGTDEDARLAALDLPVEIPDLGGVMRVLGLVEVVGENAADQAVGRVVRTALVGDLVALGWTPPPAEPPKGQSPVDPPDLHPEQR